MYMFAHQFIIMSKHRFFVLLLKIISSDLSLNIFSCSASHVVSS